MKYVVTKAEKDAMQDKLHDLYELLDGPEDEDYPLNLTAIRNDIQRLEEVLKNAVIVHYFHINLWAVNDQLNSDVLDLTREFDSEFTAETEKDAYDYLMEFQETIETTLEIRLNEAAEESGLYGDDLSPAGIQEVLDKVPNIFDFVDVFDEDKQEYVPVRLA